MGPSIVGATSSVSFVIILPGPPRSMFTSGAATIVGKSYVLQYLQCMEACKAGSNVHFPPLQIQRLCDKDIVGD